jgi:hypothetical protein
MTAKMIFSVKLLNTKGIDNFIRFLESTKTQESKFVCGRYDRNIKLDSHSSPVVVLSNPLFMVPANNLTVTKNSLLFLVSAILNNWY